MGLDVGNRRIGVAVSDALKLIARPLQVIDRRKGNAVTAICELIRVQLVDEVIVGYPYNADGSVGKQARLVEQFVNTLRQSSSLPVRLCDERYSTGEAREIINGKKRKDPLQHDDAIAAAVILQRYLNALHPDGDSQDIEESPDIVSPENNK